MKYPMFHLFWNYLRKTKKFPWPKALWRSIGAERDWRKERKRLKMMAKLYDKLRKPEIEPEGKYLTHPILTIKKKKPSKEVTEEERQELLKYLKRGTYK